VIRGAPPLFFRILNRSSCKTYLVGCPETKEAVLIDPLAQKVDSYVATLAYFGYKLNMIIDTHSHADHKTGTVDLADITGAKIVMNRRAPSPVVHIHVKDNDTLNIGSLTLRILETPGHTPDSISIHVADRVFVGDALLVRKTGRTDFAGGNSAQLYDSINKKLFTLPDDTIIFPCHDYSGNIQSSVAEEKQFNTHIKIGTTKEQFVKTMHDLNLPLPKSIQEVLQPNQSGIEDPAFAFPSHEQLCQVVQLNPAQIKNSLKNNGPLIVDVRETFELQGDLPALDGSLHIPLKDLIPRIKELEPHKGRDIVFVCRAGVRSTIAGALVNTLNAGFGKVYNMDGGLVDWYHENCEDNCKV